MSEHTSRSQQGEAPGAAGAAASAAASAELLRAALDALWGRARRCDFELLRARELRPAVQRLAAEARVASLRPETLLLLVKESWRALPEMRRASRRPAADELLERVVSMCVEEYFRSSDGPR